MTSTLAASGNSISSLTAPVASATPYNIIHGTRPQLIAFLVLNLWPSHFGIPVLLAVIVLSKKIRRHPTFINLCIIFIIEGFSSTLLLYAGKIQGPEPSKVLCLLQASLLYGYPPMSSVGVFVLVLQMFFALTTSHQEEIYKEKNHVIRVWAMLTAPWIAFFATLLTTAILGVATPEKVSRNRRFFYCSLESTAWTNSLTVFSAIFLFLTLIFEVWLLVILRKRWASTQSKGRSLSSLDVSLPLRIVVFGLYLTLALSLSLLSIKAPESPVPDLMIATASSVFVLIFGTQRDILKVLCFWRRKRPEQTRFIVTLQDSEGGIEGKQKEVQVSAQLSWPRIHAV